MSVRSDFRWSVQRARWLVLGAALVLIPATPVRAEYPIFEARIVPVARIISNLQTAIAGEPSNVALRINLKPLSAWGIVSLSWPAHI